MILSPALTSHPALWPTVVAIAAYLMAAAWPLRPNGNEIRQERTIWLALMVGWWGQAIAIVLDILVFDSQQAVVGARFGFGAALSITSWLVTTVYAFESRQLGLPGIRRALSLLGAVTVALCWLFPGRIQMSTGVSWAPLHWMLGFASYGLFGAALLHAALWRHAERQLRRPKLNANATSGFATNGRVLGMPLLRLESLTLWFVWAGFIMLSLTLALGIAFSHPWRWDHKSVFSVLSWVVFATLLAGRYHFGWRGKQAIRWLVAGCVLLLLSYVGSRFVMEVVLHRAALS